jgi:hypothetical protein
MNEFRSSVSPLTRQIRIRSSGLRVVGKKRCVSLSPSCHMSSTSWRPLVTQHDSSDQSLHSQSIFTRSSLPSAQRTSDEALGGKRHKSKFRKHYSTSLNNHSDIWHRAYIALGSNVGDRLEMVEQACRHLREDPDIRLLRTSSLYETEAMYVVDQEPFLNGACEVSVSRTLGGRSG